MYTKKIMDFGKQVRDDYEFVGKQVVEQVSQRCGAVHGALASRVYSSALEALINVCALTGFFAFPACIVLAAKRIFPIHPVLTELVKGSKESLSVKWREFVEFYKRALTDTIAPGLMVAFAVDAVFCSVVGILTLNPIFLLRAGALSGPTAFFIYRALVHDIVTRGTAPSVSVVAQERAVEPPCAERMPAPDASVAAGRAVSQQQELPAAMYPQAESLS